MSSTVIARYQVPAVGSFFLRGVEVHTSCWGTGIHIQSASVQNKGKIILFI